MSFDTLGLQPELLRAVAEQGYTEPTPVQAQAIPHVLAGRDVLAGAQTGTGKTAAFVLPILQLLQTNRPAPRHSIGKRPKGATGLPIRCLVLVPTRELALQVEESVRTYGKTRPVRSAAVYGGVGYAPQIDAVRGGPEILVATPGRLLDHAGEGIVDLSKVEILVLDEADRMLDMGFIRDIRRIIGLLPARRQNLLFSATFSDDIRSLSNSILNDPVQIQVAKRNAPIDLVRQVAIRVDRDRKRDLLRDLWASERIDQALVFVRSKHGAGRLAEQLQRDGIPAAAIHGDRTQSQRIRALDDFKEGRVDILVATEVAARGLDIEGLPHVVNYELPLVPEDYIHRIGRTGRAGMEGDAISLVAADELDLLADIERLLGTRIPTGFFDGYEPTESGPARGSGRGRGGLRGAGPRTNPGTGGNPGTDGGRARGPRRVENGGSAGGGSGRPARRRSGRSDAPATPRPAQDRVSADGRDFTTLPGERFANRGPAAG